MFSFAVKSSTSGTTGGSANANRLSVEAQTAGGYKYLVLGQLFLVYTLAFIDRQIIVILGEEIKIDLGLNDTQLGALTGFTFALFYVTLGIPVARLADRFNRVTILSISLATWSGMTAVCALAGSFWQLALARFGVGIGEAGCNPPAYSIIADYFPPANRSTALSIYVSGGTALGILVGFALGGIIADSYGWRAAFLLVGLPGILLAIILKLTVREPVREGKGSDVAAPPAFLPTISTLLRSWTFVWISLAVALNAFVIYAVLNWLPILVIREHGAATTAVGTRLGLIFGIGMAAGGLLVGWISDRLARRDQRFYVWVPAIAIAITPPFFVNSFGADTADGVIMLAIIPSIFLNCTAGPVLTVLMGLVETRARALASAIFLLVVNVAGLGISPMSVGLLSDILSATYGAKSLSTALTYVVWLNLIAALCFLIAARHLRRDLHQASRH